MTRADGGWGGQPTALVLLECLDFSEVLNGEDPEALRLGDLLRAVFEPYGELLRLRLFPEQEAAAIEFADVGASARAQVNEDRRQMGRKPVRLLRGTLLPCCLVQYARAITAPLCHCTLLCHLSKQEGVIR